MSFIHSVFTAVPPHRESKSEIVGAGERWLGKGTHEFELFSRFVSSSKVGQRHFAVPAGQILSIKGQEQRAAIFEEEGTRLGFDALSGAASAANLDPAMLGALVFASCSVPVIPSIDARIAAALGCSSKMNRVPIFQYGCAGGSAGLALANRLVPSCGPTAILSVELCSLVHHREDLSGASLLGAALFGDGAACAVLTPEPAPLEIIDSCSFLIPRTGHLMGYNHLDDGMHLRLDKELPSILAKTAPGVIAEFLAAHELKHSEINYWLFHPGGAKILSALETEFSIEKRQSRWAWEVLEQFGNMSSATVLFVLNRFLDDHPFASGERALLMGIGPGLTIELSLFGCH